MEKESKSTNKRALIIGYIVGIVGLGLITWNAVTYFRGISDKTNLLGPGILLVIVGALLINYFRSARKQ